MSTSSRRGSVYESDGEVGRMKYLKPLYRALAGRDAELARETFERNRPRYHTITVQVVEAQLKSA